MVMPHTPDCGAQKSLAGGGHVWLLPLRKPVVDADDHLRLGYWEGNEKMKGEPLTLTQRTLTTAPAPGPAAGDVRAAWLDGSGAWDHTAGVIISGVITVAGEGNQVGFVFQSQSATGAGGAPNDLGPDNGWDREGNDYDCFSVPANFTPSDCAGACEADTKCQAWTMIKAAEATAGNTEGMGQPCAHGKALRQPYCTLKAPIPVVIRPSAAAYTGLPQRSKWWVANHTHQHGTHTNDMLLMGVAADTDAARSTKVFTHVNGTTRYVLRDTTGAFPCGKGVTCMPATKTGIAPGAHPFLLQARHGTVDVYVGTPLMLVQTWLYGTYPQAKSRFGLVANGTGTASLTQLSAWPMNLAPAEPAGDAP